MPGILGQRGCLAAGDSIRHQDLAEAKLSEREGRHLCARERIQKGSLILVEDAAVAVLTKYERKRVKPSHQHKGCKHCIGILLLWQEKTHCFSIEDAINNQNLSYYP